MSIMFFSLSFSRLKHSLLLSSLIQWLSRSLLFERKRSRHPIRQTSRLCLTTLSSCMSSRLQVIQYIACIPFHPHSLLFGSSFSRSTFDSLLISSCHRFCSASHVGLENFKRIVLINFSSKSRCKWAPQERDQGWNVEESDECKQLHPMHIQERGRKESLGRILQLFLWRMSRRSWFQRCSCCRHEQPIPLLCPGGRSVVGDDSVTDQPVGRLSWCIGGQTRRSGGAHDQLFTPCIPASSSREEKRQ